MTINIILIYAATAFVLSLTPGPSVLLVVGQGMKHGFASSIRGSLGISAGNIFYSILSALGLGAILLASTTLFTVVKYAGAAYLIYVGLQMILAKAAPDSTIATERSVSQNSFKFFTQGVITQLSNPKALVFFTALLPQFIDVEAGSVFWQFVILEVIATSIELPILLLYGWLAHRGQALLPKKWATLPDRIGGGFLIATGVALALQTQMNE